MMAENTSDQSATDRMRSQAQKVTSDIHEMGSIVGDVVQENLGQIRDTASAYFEQERDEVHRVERTLESYIKDRPIQSIMIAAGVGLVVGRFWPRR
jgi:ElaB/YqjD/DUF883 family membrane-anchored ribosome-binding protein